MYFWSAYKFPQDKDNPSWILIGIALSLYDIFLERKDILKKYFKSHNLVSSVICLDLFNVLIIF